MKKILSYAAAAILLGTVMMLAPAMLLKSNYYGSVAFTGGEAVPRYCPEAQKTFAIVEVETLDTEEALGRAIRPSNLLSAGLMLIPSFLLALGVSLYLKKRIF
jgi:hypothetical protein